MRPPEVIPPIPLQFPKNLPVCFSATFSVNPSNGTGSLRPFPLAAYTCIFRTFPGSSPLTTNTGNLEVTLAWRTPVFQSNTSNRKYCGWPPEKYKKKWNELSGVMRLEDVVVFFYFLVWLSYRREGAMDGNLKRIGTKLMEYLEFVITGDANSSQNSTFKIMSSFLF